MLRFHLFTLLLCLCFSCRTGSASAPLPEPNFKPAITIFTPNILLETPDKTNATIRFAALSSWFIVINNEKSSVSWISINNTSGEAGTIEITVEITEPNPSSLHQREAYLKIVSDTAFRVVAITQPSRISTEIAATNVRLNKSDTKFPVGSTETLFATVLPANATNQSVIWSSSDPAIATVDQTGAVNGISNGNTIVTATTADADKTAQCHVTILTSPESGGQINGWN